MRRILNLILVGSLLFSSTFVFAANPMQNLSGVGAKDTPTSYQIVVDYESRTDGQPVYLGYAPMGRGVSEDAWVIYNYQYDGSGFFLTKKTAFGIWDNRGSLTYQ